MSLSRKILDYFAKNPVPKLRDVQENLRKVGPVELVDKAREFDEMQLVLYCEVVLWELRDLPFMLKPLWVNALSSIKKQYERVFDTPFNYLTKGDRSMLERLAGDHEYLREPIREILR